MGRDEIVRASLGTPIALCVSCAAAWRQAYTIRQQGLSHNIACEGCHKRRLGAAYIVEKKVVADNE